jgi:dipeptidyl aminopeptidase/acylaminoacyl peptidase
MNGMRPADIALLAGADDVRLAPDGRRIAFSVTTVDGPANRYRTRIWIGPTDGSAPSRPVTAGQPSDSLPRWSPDGRSLAFVSERGEGASGLWILPVDGPGEPTLVCARPDSISEVAWAPDGASVAFIGREPDPARRGPDGTELPLAGQPPRRITHLFSRLNGEDWVSDRPEALFVVPLDGSAPPRRLLAGDQPVGAPTWSPDGTTLAVVGARHPDWDLDLCNDIWLVDTDGVRPPVRVTDTSASWAALAWSPDGRSIAYLETPVPTEEPRHIRLGVLDVADRTRRRLAADVDRNLGPYGHSRAPVWDGDRLLFAVERDGAVHVCTVPAVGGTVTTVVGGDRVCHTFDAVAGIVAVAVTSPRRPADISVVDATGTERLVVSLAGDLARTRTLVAPQRFVTRHADGVEVECWAMPPVGARPGERQHPRGAFHLLRLALLRRVPAPGRRRVRGGVLQPPG